MKEKRPVKLRKNADRYELLENVLKSEKGLRKSLQRFLATNDLDKEITVETCDMRLFVLLEGLGYGSLSVNRCNGSVYFCGKNSIDADVAEIISLCVEEEIEKLREEVKELLG